MAFYIRESIHSHDGYCRIKSWTGICISSEASVMLPSLSRGLSEAVQAVKNTAGKIPVRL